MTIMKQHIPYTGDSSDYELAITADNALPTAVGDANVDFRNANSNKGPKKIVISARLYGTDAANIDCTLTFYQWNERANAGSGAWVACNGIPILGTAGYPSLTVGQVGTVEVNPNSRYGYVRANGLSGGAAAQSLGVLVEKVE